MQLINFFYLHSMHKDSNGFIKKKRIQMERLPIGEGPKRTHQLGGPIGHGGAPWPTIQPENQRPGRRLTPPWGLNHPIEQQPPSPSVHSDIPGKLRKHHIVRLPRQLQYPIRRLLFPVSAASGRGSKQNCKTQDPEEEEEDR